MAQKLSTTTRPRKIGQPQLAAVEFGKLHIRRRLRIGGCVCGWLRSTGRPVLTSIRGWAAHWPSQELASTVTRFVITSKPITIKITPEKTSTLCRCLRKFL